MPKSLSPIPEGVAITEAKGIITIFFRLAWQALVDSFQIVPTLAGEPDLAKLGQTAALVTTKLYTTLSAAMYRVNYALLRTIADGVSSSATVTIGWTQNGVARTEAEVALTEAAGLSQQSLSKPIFADAVTDITIAIAYASNTPNKMTYDLHAAVEQFA